MDSSVEVEGSRSSASGAAFTVLDRLSAARGRVSAWAARPQARRLLLITGAALFVLTAVISLANLPETPHAVSWSTLAIVTLVFAPATAILSAAEYHQTARLVGADVSWRNAVEVSIASSAANLLPLPGSFIVRSAALQGAGASRGEAIAAPLSVGFAWIGIGGLLGGGWLLVTAPNGFAAIMFIAGLVVMALSALAVQRTKNEHSSIAMRSIWLVEAAMTLLAGFRFYLIIDALGFDISMGQGLALATSSILATAVGVIPGGLGLRELLAGGFAPLVAVAAAVGVLGAVVNRIVGMIGLALVAAGLSLARSASAS